MNQQLKNTIKYLKKYLSKIQKIPLHQLTLNFNTHLKTINQFTIDYQQPILQQQYKNNYYSSQITQCLINIATIIINKLEKLKSFGKSFITIFNKHQKLFKKSIILQPKYSIPTPHKIDTEIQKIIQFYQNANRNQCTQYTLSPQFTNNKQLSYFQQHIRIFYQKQHIQNKKLNQLLTSSHSTTKSANTNQQIIDKICLKCATHFIKNNQHSNKYYLDQYCTVIYPYDSFFSIDTYGCNSYNHFLNCQNHVTSSICSMLNINIGGIILVGCQRFGTSILPKGMKINQKQKQSLEQKIKGFIGKIYPKIQTNKQVFVDFVPIMKVQQKTLIKQAFEGNFVFRIFVQSSKPQHVYFIKYGTQMLLQTREKGNLVKIEDEQHYNYILKKFDEQSTTKRENRIKTDHNFIKCKSPLTGIKTYTKIKQAEPEAPDMDITSTTPSSTQKPYKTWTLIICDKKTKQQITSIFKSQDILIKKMFQQQNFKYAKTTWIIQHNYTFQNLQSFIKQKKITYKDKDVKLISTNTYLQIYQNTQIDIKQLQSVINQKFNHVEIKTKIKSNQQGQNNLLISFSTLESSVFAYFYLTNEKNKVKFIRGAHYFKQTGTISNISSKEKSKTTNNTNNSNPKKQRGNRTPNSTSNQPLTYDFNNYTSNQNSISQVNYYPYNVQTTTNEVDYSNTYSQPYSNSYDYSSQQQSWNANHYLQNCLQCGSITPEQYSYYLQNYSQYQPNPQQFMGIIMNIRQNLANNYQGYDYIQQS